MFLITVWAAANATLFTGLDLGMGIGVIVLGLIADRWGYRNMYLFTLIPVVFSALFYLFYGPPGTGCRRRCLSAAVISLLKRLIFLPWQISEDTDRRYR